MAACAPAGTALPVAANIAMACAAGSGGCKTDIFLGVGIDVALQAQRLVALIEHLLVHGAVGAVADGAAFADSRMREDERADLLLVALIASFVLAIELGAAAFDGVALVRVVAITAAHLAG